MHYLDLRTAGRKRRGRGGNAISGPRHPDGFSDRRGFRVGGAFKCRRRAAFRDVGRTGPFAAIGGRGDGAGGKSGRLDDRLPVDPQRPGRGAAHRGVQPDDPVRRLRCPA